MKNRFHNCLLAILCIVGSHGWAQTFIGDAKQPINSTVILGSSASSFVPVEQAYQLAVAVEADQIIFNWSIRDGYYLYRDRFKFNAVDATSQLRSPVFETGKIKWDDYFEADVEVYYKKTSVAVPFQSSAEQIEMQIESQGCADAGLCYPPYKQWLTIDLGSGIVEIGTTPSSSAQSASSINTVGTESFSLGLILLFALAGVGAALRFNLHFNLLGGGLKRHCY